MIIVTYLCLGWYFMSALWVFHKNLECASRSFHECFQKDSNVSALCFKGDLGYFVFFLVQKSWQLPIQTQLDRNALKTHFARLSHTYNSHWNTLEIVLKYPWNTHKIAWKHPYYIRNTQANIDIYFPCHNHGHLEGKLLLQCNLASYFTSLNLFSIRAFLNTLYLCLICHILCLISNKLCVISNI